MTTPATPPYRMVRDEAICAMGLAFGAAAGAFATWISGVVGLCSVGLAFVLMAVRIGIYYRSLPSGKTGGGA